MTEPVKARAKPTPKTPPRTGPPATSSPSSPKALQNAGLALEEVTLNDLAPIDHFHTRGLDGIIDLADRLPVEAGHRVLDIGCGLGGPARYLADRFGCTVDGVDLTPPFVEAATS